MRAGLYTLYSAGSDDGKLLGPEQTIMNYHTHPLLAPQGNNLLMGEGLMFLTWTRTRRRRRNESLFCSHCWRVWTKSDSTTAYSGPSSCRGGLTLNTTGNRYPNRTQYLIRGRDPLVWCSQQEGAEHSLFPLEASCPGDFHTSHSQVVVQLS